MQEKVILYAAVHKCTLELTPRPPKPLVSNYDIQASHRNTVEAIALQKSSLVVAKSLIYRGKKKKVGMKPIESPDVCVSAV